MPLNLRRAVTFVALAASQLDGAVAFAPNQSQVLNNGATKKMTTTARDMKTKQAPATTVESSSLTSYGEQSRQYRRTVYTHEDWVRHRSSDRFVRNLSTTFDSGIYKNLAKEVLATTSVAAFVIVWNCIFGDFQDFGGASHPGLMHDSVIPVIALPLAPFTLLSPSLGLLLAFRTNQSYKRWDEARKNWGMNINHTRDLVRLGNAYYDRQAVSPERAQEDLSRLALCTWAFVRSMKRHLSPEWDDEEDFQSELFEKLPKDQAQKIIDAAHRPNRALQDLSVAIENMPMHFMRRDEVHSAATIFEDNLGSSERLLSSPIPVFYSRWTARFLSFWLLLLPLALWEPLGISWNHVDTIPVTAVLSVFLFGIEELATQLEEPFTILPMQGFCDKIYNWISEIASFVPGDNGMPVYYYDNTNINAISVNVDQVVAASTVAVAVAAEPDVDAAVNESSEVVNSMTPEIEEMVTGTSTSEASIAPAPEDNFAVEPAEVLVIEESSEVIPEERERKSSFRKFFRRK